VLEDNGGWANRDTAYLFADYAVTMHEALGDRVDVWTTLNEPWCSAFLGYTAGVHAPGRQSPADGLAAAHHLMLGHGLAVQELRSRAPEANLGITLNMDLPDPLDPTDPDDVDAARRIDGQFNRIFLDPILRGRYPEDVLADVASFGLLDHVKDGDLAIISSKIDTLGVNYYHGQAVSSRPAPTPVDSEAPVARPTSSPFPAADGVFSRPRGLPVTGMGWEVQPEGLTRVLVRLQEEYTGGAGMALYVTENGAAYEDTPDASGFVADDERRDFFDLHLRAVHAAIARGADVRGYFAWSLLDNFEWAWGYHQRFGIVRVDYDTQVRRPKSSALWYATVAESNTLPAGV
jgi:beta-glucosidase